MRATIHIETLDTFAGRNERLDFHLETEVSVPRQALDLAAETLFAMPDGHGVERKRLQPLRVDVTFA